MALTMQEANVLLDNVHTEAELRNLLDQLDINSEGKTTVLYSGNVAEGIGSGDIIKGMLANGDNVRVIDTTEAAKFLDIFSDLNKNQKLIDKLENIFGTDPTIKGTAGNQFLFGQFDSNGTRIPNGAWDAVSSRFVDATVGEVKTLTGGAGADRVFAQTEVARLLQNADITHIDGIPIEKLRILGDAEAFKTISAQSAIDSAYLKIATDANGIPLIIDGQARLDTREYFASTPGMEGKAPVIETPMRSMSEFITPAALEAHRAGAAHLQEIKADLTAQSKLPGAENAALRATALKALNRLGIAGDILALVPRLREFEGFIRALVSSPPLGGRWQLVGRRGRVFREHVL
jgi:hypothetical protein